MRITMKKILMIKVNNYFSKIFLCIKNTNKDCEKKYVKDIKIFLKKTTKCEKRSEIDIKIVLKNKSKNHLSVWKNIIYHLKGNYLVTLKILAQ